MIRKSQLIPNHEILNSLGTSKRQCVGVDVKIVMNALAGLENQELRFTKVKAGGGDSASMLTCPRDSLKSSLRLKVHLRQMTGRAGCHSSGMKKWIIGPSEVVYMILCI